MDEKPDGWNQELYEKLSFDFLIECAEKKNIDEWNALYLEYLESEWRRVYPEKEWDPKNVMEFVRHSQFIRPNFSGSNFREAISRGLYFQAAHLEGADLSWSHLERASFTDTHLEGAYLSDAHFEGADVRWAHFEGAYFGDAHLEGADFFEAHLEGADVRRTHLEGADVRGAHLEGAYFWEAHLEGVSFWGAHFEGAYFWEAHFERADVRRAHLEGAKLQKAHLEGTDFSEAHLEGAEFIYAIVNGETLFTENTIDKNTDFTGTGLSATRIDPVLRTKLEKNIREIQWNHWYKNHKYLQIIMRPFWFLTDYGASTIRPVCAFILWNTIFAIIYFLWLGNDFNELMIPYTGPFLESIGNNSVAFCTDLLKSNLMIISLTDMATIKIELITLFFVFLHVFVGYFILAALVARLSIMFQNLSPNDE